MNRNTNFLIAKQDVRGSINLALAVSRLWSNCHEFKLVAKWKCLAFLFFFLAISSASFAQQAYHGGSGDGYASASTNTVTLDINGEVQKPSISFSIFPNPALANQPVSITVKETACRLSMYTVDGKIMYSAKVENSRPGIPVLPCGTYFLKMENENAFSIQKLIVLPKR